MIAFFDIMSSKITPIEANGDTGKRHCFSKKKPNTRIAPCGYGLAVKRNCGV
jgi:hypothetical protein